MVDNGYNLATLKSNALFQASTYGTQGLVRWYARCGTEVRS